MKSNEASVIKWANEYDDELLSSDFREDHVVRISFLDNTSQFFKKAFMVEYDGDWICVFTEKNGCSVFNKDDIKCYAEYKKVLNIKEIAADY